MDKIKPVKIPTWVGKVPSIAKKLLAVGCGGRVIFFEMWQVVGCPYLSAWATSICTWLALIGINELLITIIMLENQRGWRKLVRGDRIKYIVDMHENFME